MSKKSKGPNPPMVTMMAVTGGVFVLRKVLAFLWTKVTGKTPPTDLTDPKVTLPEALAWALATGVVIEAARYAVLHNTARRPEVAADGESAPESN
jgi:Protein of unknown function (DUF4235)